jgi:hypothetical protein
MDLAAPFKTEVLRPLVTLAVPGTIAIAPYILVLGHYVPSVETFWSQHPSAFAALVVLVVVAAGFIIDDIGANIEFYIWDPLLARHDPAHVTNWHKYLKLELGDELVGQRYLRHKFTQLKFELAMATALPIFWSGLMWLNGIYAMWARAGVTLVTIVIAGGSAYLLFESSQTAKVLANTRALILESIAEGVKGIPNKPTGA